MRALLVSLVLLLSGCQYIPFLRHKEPAPNTPAAAHSEVAASTAGAAQAHATVEQKADEVASKVLVNVQEARRANQNQPAGPNTTVVDGELGLAESRLSGVKPSAEEQLAAEQRRVLVESGKVEEARRAYDSAKADAKRMSDEVVSARAAAAAADAKAAAAVEHEGRAIADATKRYNELLAAQRSEEAAAQARDLRWAAAGCLAIFLLGAGFGQLAGLRLVWPFGLIALLLFGLAQIVTQPWFMPACGIALLLGLAGAGYWIWQHYRAGTLAQDAKEKAEKFSAVAKAVVPVLDEAYDSATEPLKQLLDEKVFGPLSKAMHNTEAKATVHEIRAEQAS